MVEAPYCDDIDALLDVARTFNGQAFIEPLDDDEVTRVTRSAWGYEQRNENWTRGGCAIVNHKVADALMALSSDLYTLITWLMAHNGFESEFMVANGLRTRLSGWTIPRIQKARRLAIEHGWLVQPRRGLQEQGRHLSLGSCKREPILTLSAPTHPGLRRNDEGCIV